MMARCKYGGENVGPSERRNGRTVEDGKEEKARRSQMPQRGQQCWMGSPLTCGSKQDQHACNISTALRSPAKVIRSSERFGSRVLPHCSAQRTSCRLAGEPQPVNPHQFHRERNRRPTLPYIRPHTARHLP